MTAAVVPSLIVPGSRDPWQQFEKACRSTPFYSSTSADRLRQRAPVDLETYFGRPAEFRNHASPALRPRALEAPWEAGRLLAAGCWFPVAGAANLRHPGCAQIERTRPDTLAGPPAALASIARAVRERRLRLAPLRRGVVVFENLTGPTMDGALERELWEVFEAPVVKQIRGFQGELLANHCDARQGLHVVPANAYWEVERRAGGRLLVTSFLNLRYPVARLRTRLAGDIVWSPCTCGQSAPRIGDLRDWQATAMKPERFVLAATGS